MKKQELKAIIKPLIKECLREVLVEEGLTRMLAESLAQPSAINQTKIVQRENLQPTPVQRNTLLEAQQNRKKLLDAVGSGGFDPFTGTEPLKEDKQIVSGDPGVDISKLLGENQQVWKQTLSALNGKKAKE